MTYYYEHREEINKAKRLKYANDKQYRDKIIAQTIAYAKDHPEVNRRTQRKRKYGLTHDEVIKLLELQNYQCAIGFEPIDENTMHIDHDHKTNKVRGLLCFTHNVGLGHFKDDIDTLKKAIEYLERYG